MKRHIPILALAFSAIFASCTVLMPQLRLTGVMLLGESERKTNLVTISAQPGWDDHGKDNNGSFSPFVQGQRYEDYSRPMASMVIPPFGSARKYIYSSQQVYREAGKSGNWKLRPIQADQVFLVFCVQSRDMVDYYTVEVR
ncbi:MAG: hypothetical protein FD137_85 [Spirochaetes bacterium]|nr:MAG: hypothetical protein FD137_85 [Spirochaetota bacterium]